MAHRRMVPPHYYYGAQTQISLIYYACKQRTDPVYTFHTAHHRMVPPHYYYGAQYPIVYNEGNPYFYSVVSVSMSHMFSV